MRHKAATLPFEEGDGAHNNNMYKQKLCRPKDFETATRKSETDPLSYYVSYFRNFVNHERRELTNFHCIHSAVA